jgi:hypothetical protein
MWIVKSAEKDTTSPAVVLRPLDAGRESNRGYQVLAGYDLVGNWGTDVLVATKWREGRATHHVDYRISGGSIYRRGWARN